MGDEYGKFEKGNTLSDEDLFNFIHGRYPNEKINFREEIT